MESTSSVAPAGASKGHTLETWQEYKPLILQLYKNHTLREVMVAMKERGFSASERQYKSKLKYWGAEKYISSSQMNFIARKMADRAKLGKSTVFYTHGQIISEEKIERYKSRNKVPETSVREETPEGLTYHTPEEVESPTRTAASPVPSRINTSASTMAQDRRYLGGLEPKNRLKSTASEIVNRLNFINPTENITASPAALIQKTSSNSSLRKTRTRSYIILLFWNYDKRNEAVMNAIQQLATAFQQKFRFETHIWEIPSHNCLIEVHGKILEIARFLQSHDLLVVYYIGHSRITERNQLIWASSSNPNDESYCTVKWSGIQNILEGTKSDILLLFDCQFFSEASYDGHGVLECLAASTFFFEIDNQVGQFTRVVTEELIKLSSQSEPFQITLLYHRILLNLQKQWREGKLISSPSTPIHVALGEDTQVDRRIILFPAEESDLVTDDTLTFQELQTRDSVVSGSHHPHGNRTFLNPRSTHGELLTSNPSTKNPISRPEPSGSPSHSPRASPRPLDKRSTMITSHPVTQGNIEWQGEPAFPANPTTPRRTWSSDEDDRPSKRRRVFGDIGKMHNKYQCTFRGCGRSFIGISSWKRHENEMHFPRGKWECVFEGYGPEVSCHVCHRNISEDHVACVSRDTRKSHTFRHKELLIRHIKEAHGCEATIPGRDFFIESERPKQCGFCGVACSDWDARCDHVANHFTEGAQVATDWKLWPRERNDETLVQRPSEEDDDADSVNGSDEDESIEF